MTERETLAAKRPNLALRARVLCAVRAFFIREGFLEVETPLRTPAPAPEPHIVPVPSDGWYLAASPELHMKRLLAAGYDKIFQVARVFRKGERGRLHHPEFTMLEWYRADEGYAALMTDCERLLGACREAAGNIVTPSRRGRPLETVTPFPRVTVREAFMRHAGWEPGADPDPARFDTDMVEKVEGGLGFPRPVFLCEYPASRAALARLKPGDPAVAERFELYWGGVELADGFGELTDPVEQRRRFEDARRETASRGIAPPPLPERFLESLSALPPSAGIALGVDRLVMLLAGAESIDDVTAFPPGTIEAEGTTPTSSPPRGAADSR